MTLLHRPDEPGPGPRLSGSTSPGTTEPAPNGTAPVVVVGEAKHGSRLVRIFLEPTLEETRRMATLVGPVFVGCALLLLPWTAYLYLTLPVRQVSHNYGLAWAGFDVGLVLALAATTWALLRLSRVLPIAASSLGSLLVVDAWFDILTSRPGSDRLLAVLMAVVAELPLALVAYWMAYHGQALRERAIAVRLARAVRRGRPLDRSYLRRVVRRPRA